MPDGGQGLSAAQIRKQADASLQRLRTDYVDLYQCHRYDPDVPLEETMEALTELVRQGKARYLGFSEWTAEQIEAALAIPGVERFVSSQPEYSILWRKIEPEILERVRAPRGSARSCGRRWPRGRSPASTSPGARPPAGSRAANDVDGPVDGPLARRRGAGGGAAAAAHRRRPRPVDGPAGPGVGPAPAQRGVGHHRAPAVPSRSTTTWARSASPSTTATLAAIDEAVDGVVGP